MSRTVWDRLRPYLSQVVAVDFSGGGEPLLNARLLERIRDAKSHGCRAGFLSNGMLLDDRTCRGILDAGTDWVAISMDGANAEIYEKVRKKAAFHSVSQNIAHLASMRVGPNPKIAINVVMMPANVHQLNEFVRLADKLGVDQVNFKQCDVVRGEHGLGFALFASQRQKNQRRYERMLARARRLARRLKIKTTAFSFVPNELPVCAQDPRDSLFIRYDGKVAPCISLAYGGDANFLGRQEPMATVHYGSLLETDLPELCATESCQLYQQTFQRRVEAHDTQLISSVAEASIFDLEQILQSAKKAMPKPPGSCRSCHYLYDI